MVRKPTLRTPHVPLFSHNPPTAGEVPPRRLVKTCTMRFRGNAIICRVSVVILVVVATVGRDGEVIGGNPARTVRTPWWAPLGIYLGWMPPSREMTWLVS